MKRRILVSLLSLVLVAAAVAALFRWGPELLRSTESPADQPVADQPAATAKPTAAAQPDGSSAATSTDGAPAADTPTTEAPATPAEEATPAAGTVELPTPSETPRSAAHAVALTTAEILKGDRVDEKLAILVERGQMTQAAADALSQWSKKHRVARVEEVASTREADGSVTTRYRLVSEDGASDMVMTLVTSPDGSVRVVDAYESSSDRSNISSAADSLSVAEGFLDAVRHGEMGKARRMVTGSEVSDATIAGVCMLFEEGDFVLREASPIRGSFANAEHAGYLVYLQDPSKPDDKTPHFIGLELTRVGDVWRISGVSLDSLLSSYEERGRAEGGHYFPIVKNPKGGDSLALFFAFNEAKLTPRSQRQLRIVAELLKDSQKKLNISGHTDDVGSAEYNQGLSERRAAAVKDALVSFGVQDAQITTRGLGKSQPRRTYTDSASEEDIRYIRGENRRAEIYLDFEP